MNIFIYQKFKDNDVRLILREQQGHFIKLWTDQRFVEGIKQKTEIVILQMELLRVLVVGD